MTALANSSSSSKAINIASTEVNHSIPPISSPLPRKNVRRIIVGMSGGVDSSVAAFLLKSEGYEIEGLFMKNWREENSSGHCTTEEDAKDAEQICDKLDIKLHIADFSQEYWDSVFQHCLNEFARGRTPNPDILCNREIKFNVFLRHALALGADAIATGHYARIAQTKEGRFTLNKAKDNGKDQSYFLCALNESVLAKTFFPLGDREKKEVREIAKMAGFQNHQKKDSTGICFIGERKFKNFLLDFLPAQKGPIESVEGQHLGVHEGLMFYTLGQRQGLGIGGTQKNEGLPWYVVEKDLEHNRLIVAQGALHPKLFRHSLIVADLHWIRGTPPDNLDENESHSLRLSAKIRYRQQDAPCRLYLKNASQGEVIFDEAQRAITPGQSVVFYQGEHCLGGGIIQ